MSYQKNCIQDLARIIHDELRAIDKIVREVFRDERDRFLFDLGINNKGKTAYRDSFATFCNKKDFSAIQSMELKDSFWSIRQCLERILEGLLKIDILSHSQAKTKIKIIISYYDKKRSNIICRIQAYGIDIATISHAFSKDVACDDDINLLPESDIISRNTRSIFQGSRAREKEEVDSLCERLSVLCDYFSHVKDFKSLGVVQVLAPTVSKKPFILPGVERVDAVFILGYLLRYIDVVKISRIVVTSVNEAKEQKEILLSSH